MQIEVPSLGLLRWPRIVLVPGVRPRLKRARLPRQLLAFAVQVIAEEGRLNILTKFAPGLVSTEGNRTDRLSFLASPFSVIPGSSDYEVVPLRVVLCRIAENLPGTPWIFLVPESRHI